MKSVFTELQFNSPSKNCSFADCQVSDVDAVDALLSEVVASVSLLRSPIISYHDASASETSTDEEIVESIVDELINKICLVANRIKSDKTKNERNKISSSIIESSPLEEIITGNGHDPSTMKDARIKGEEMAKVGQSKIESALVADSDKISSSTLESDANLAANNEKNSLKFADGSGASANRQEANACLPRGTRLGSALPEISPYLSDADQVPSISMSTDTFAPVNMDKQQLSSVLPENRSQSHSEQQALGCGLEASFGFRSKQENSTATFEPEGPNSNSSASKQAPSDVYLASAKLLQEIRSSEVDEDSERNASQLLPDQVQSDHAASVDTFRPKAEQKDFHSSGIKAKDAEDVSPSNASQPSGGEKPEESMRKHTTYLKSDLTNIHLYAGVVSSQESPHSKS